MRFPAARYQFAMPKRETAQVIMPPRRRGKSDTAIHPSVHPMVQLPYAIGTLAACSLATRDGQTKKGKGSPYSITEHRVPELIPVLGSQPAGDVSHKPGGRLPLLSARPAVTLATLKSAATNFADW